MSTLRSKISQLWAGAEPLSGWPALAFAALLPIVFYLGFSANQPCLMLGLDGTWYRTMFAYEALDRAPFTQTGVDALSGSFDAWYPLQREFLLPHALMLPFSSVAPGKVFIFVIFSMLLAAAIYALARSVQVGRAPALAAAVAMPVLAGAGLADGVAKFFPLFEANPYWFQSTALGCLIIASIWTLNSKRPARTAALIVAPALCFVLAVISEAPHVLFIVPVVGTYSAGSLLIARRVSDVTIRIAAGLLAIAVAAALGIFTYYYAIIGYTAYRFFPAEIAHPLGGWMGMSAVFWSPLAAFIVMAGLAGALWSAVAGKDRLRMFGVTHLVATLAFFAIAYWLAFYANSYHSSWPIYFETGMWPMALIFCAVAMVSILRVALRLVGLFTSLVSPRLLTGAVEWAFRNSGTLVLGGVIAAIAGYNLNAMARGLDSPCRLTGFAPIRATAITEALQQKIALQAGAPFRGIVATIDAAKIRPGEWVAFAGYDRGLWSDSGNDHRSAGLWHFNIPTLFQYHTFITPPYYLVITDFLSSSADHQLRSSPVLTRIDPALMALWGVRYVITDDSAAPGREIVRLPTAHSGILRLMELPNPNLGNYSPAQVAPALTFAKMLQIMHQADFDGRRVVVTDAHIRQPLVPATAAKLVYTQEGFHLTAESTGNSVLVLPAQYSHCWTIAGTGEPRLFRADAMQLGVSFRGRLNARLTFRLGPILAGSCRVEDLNDMYRLHIEKARTWAASGNALQ